MIATNSLETSERIENFFFFFRETFFESYQDRKFGMESSKMENAEEQSPLLERKIGSPSFHPANQFLDTISA